MEVQLQPLDLSLRSSKMRTSVGYAVSEHLARLYQRTLSGVCSEKAAGAVDAGGAGAPARTGVKNVLPCQVCLKTFDRPSLLKRHMRTHTGEKPHVCGVCRKGFSTSSSLNTHRRIHTGEKPHKCAECGKCFTASSNLYYHRMTHTKNKPHKCSMCPRSFPTPGDLRAHRPVHGGAWPHMCPLCARGFAKHTNLKHHLRLHATGASSQLLYASHGKDIAAILETLRLLKGPSIDHSPESTSAHLPSLPSYDPV